MTNYLRQFIVFVIALIVALMMIFGLGEKDKRRLRTLPTNTPTPARIGPYPTAFASPVQDGRVLRFR